MQLHTGPFFFSPFCFPPGANLSGCSILELEWRRGKHNSIKALGNNFFLQLRADTDKKEHDCEMGHYELHNEIQVTDKSLCRFIDLGDSGCFLYVFFFLKVTKVTALKCCICLASLMLAFS